MFSQGETLEELEHNIRDACQLMAKAQPPLTHRRVMTTELEVGA